MRRRTTAAVLALTAGLALALSACSTGGGSSTPTASAKPGQLAASVRIIQGGSEDFSDAAINKASAILEAEGVAVVSSTVADPATALRAVISGDADIALLDPVEAVKAVANGGAPVKYIGSLSQSTDYELLSLPKYTLKNLAGATFATAGAGTAGDVIASAALAKSKVDMSQVHKVTVGGTSARVTAILSGQVDLAPVLAPAGVPAVKTGKVKVLLNAGKVLGSYLQQGMIASDTFIKDKATTQAVVNAFIDAQRWAESNQSAYIAMATSNDLQAGLTLSQQKDAYQQLKVSKIFATNGAICESVITKTLNYDYEVPGGGLTKATTPAYSAWVDPTFVNAYLKKNGSDKSGYC
jgi:ABC-type nitrate/sulfonate/bicarbonate transport system substrate-binding protein